MKKYVKKHLKDEKRILKLMYKKGLFKVLGLNLNDLSWEFLLEGKRQRKRKGKNKYSFNEHLPELHIWTQDYWGEGDCRSVVRNLRDYLWFKESKQHDEDGFPNEKAKGKDELIQYLKQLPTINNDSKFNKFLVLNNGNF